MANAKFDCELCKVTTYDQKAYDSHVLGARHQAALNSKLKIEKTKKCGVFVTGFPKTTNTQGLVDLFLKYGPIDNYFSGRNNNFFIINYQKEDSAKSVLQSKVFYEGQLLTVRPRKVKENVVENRKIPNIIDSISPERITVFLSKWSFFGTQLMKLVEELRLPEHEMQRKYGTLCYDLQTSLSSRFPGCIAWPFGSTVSGLNFRDSDVDVYIEVPLYCNPSLSQQNACEYTKQARNLLLKSSLFTNVIGIPHAKTPIVKCVHAPTGVSCDFNFKNMLGVCNSRLIRYMLSLDLRLQPFMIVLKYWGKVHKLCGSGRLSNYGLVMLAIFFLQHMPNPILPPVCVLQIPAFRDMQAGWNGGFCPNPDLKPPTANSLTIYELLREFFKFCSKFDYGLNVIAPLTGNYYSKADFAQPTELPDVFFHYKAMLKTTKPLKIDCALCIQDPFELTHNLTGSVSMKLLEDFKAYCEISANICETYGPSNLLLSKLIEPVLLCALPQSDNTCEFKIPVGKTLACIEKSIESDVEDKSTLLRRMWFEKVHQFLISVLKKILMLDVDVKKVLPQSKLKKMEGQSDIHDESVLDSLQFHCFGYCNVWEGRKQANRSLTTTNVKTTSFFEQEAAISDYIANTIYKALPKTERIVDFNLTLKCKKNPTEADIFLQNVQSKKNNFKQMTNFFVSKFPPWFEKHMTLVNTVNDEKNMEEKSTILIKGLNNQTTTISDS